MRRPYPRILFHLLNMADPKITHPNTPRLPLTLQSLQRLIHLFHSRRASTWRMYEEEIDITLLSVNLMNTIQALLVRLLRTATSAQDFRGKEDFVAWYS